MFVLKSKHRNNCSYLSAYCGWGQLFTEEKDAMKFNSKEEAEEELKQLEKLVKQDLDELDAHEVISDIEVIQL